MRYLLFATMACPKCPTIKTFVAENLDFPGEILDDTTPDFLERAGKFQITAAPTLLIFDENDTEIFRGNEVVEIADFLASQK